MNLSYAMLNSYSPPTPLQFFLHRCIYIKLLKQSICIVFSHCNKISCFKSDSIYITIQNAKPKAIIARKEQYKTNPTNQNTQN